MHLFDVINKPTQYLSNKSPYLIIIINLSPVIMLLFIHLNYLTGQSFFRYNSLSFFLLYIIMLLLYIVSFSAFFESVIRKVVLRQNVHNKEIYAMDAFEFERLVGGILELKGFYVEMRGGPRPDGGIDILVKKAGKKIAVQCKHILVDDISPEPVRALYGVMKMNKLDGAMFVTSGQFSEAATDEFEKYKEMQLVGKSTLVGWLQEESQKIEKADDVSSKLAGFLLSMKKEIASEGNVIVPRCPRCNQQMVLRMNKNSKVRFWACKEMSSCNETRSLSKHQIAILDPNRKLNPYSNKS